MPALLDIAEPDDCITSINSFSKAWSMTGWRLGWITAPEFLLDTLDKLTEYNILCSPAFAQMAGVTAIKDGEDFVVAQQEHLRQMRGLVGCKGACRLSAHPHERA